MKKGIAVALTFLLSCMAIETTLALERYGKKLCKKTGYECYRVKGGDSWEKLFPNPEEKDIVKRINRMNIRLRPGMTIAIPNNLENSTIYDHSPFPRYIEPVGEKVVFVSQNKLAWGAYNEAGELLWWGPIASGADSCKGVRGKCHTPGGTYRVIRKQGIECISTAFPRRRNGVHGGAAMPFCMHFFRGFALHGSYTVPGMRASHGCVRMFIEDAQWLNKHFINTPGFEDKGTRVIVEPVKT